MFVEMDAYFENFKGCDNFRGFTKNRCKKIHTKMIELQKRKKINDSKIQLYSDNCLKNTRNCHALSKDEMSKCLDEIDHVKSLLVNEKSRINSYIFKVLKQNELLTVIRNDFRPFAVTECHESLKKLGHDGTIILKCTQNNAKMFQICKKIDDVFYKDNWRKYTWYYDLNSLRSEILDFDYVNEGDEWVWQYTFKCSDVFNM